MKVSFSYNLKQSKIPLKASWSVNKGLSEILLGTIISEEKRSKYFISLNHVSLMNNTTLKSFTSMDQICRLHNDHHKYIEIHGIERSYSVRNLRKWTIPSDRFQIIAMSGLPYLHFFRITKFSLEIRFRSVCKMWVLVHRL